MVEHARCSKAKNDCCYSVFNLRLNIILKHSQQIAKRSNYTSTALNNKHILIFEKKRSCLCRERYESETESDSGFPYNRSVNE